MHNVCAQWCAAQQARTETAALSAHPLKHMVRGSGSSVFRRRKTERLYLLRSRGRKVVVERTCARKASGGA